MQRAVIVEALNYLHQDMAEVGIPEPVSRALLTDAADYRGLDVTEKSAVFQSTGDTPEDSERITLEMLRGGHE